MRPLDPASDLLRAAARGGEDADLHAADEAARLPYTTHPNRPGTRRDKDQLR